MEWNRDDLDYIAIIMTVVAGQAFGALWFSPILPGNQWMDAIGTAKEEITARPGPKAVPFAISIAQGFATMFVVAHILQQLNNPGIEKGLLIGAILGVAAFATMDATHKAVAGNNLKHFLIANGHTVIDFLIVGAITGVWHSAGRAAVWRKFGDAGVDASAGPSRTSEHGWVRLRTRMSMKRRTSDANAQVGRDGVIVAKLQSARTSCLIPVRRRA